MKALKTFYDWFWVRAVWIVLFYITVKFWLFMYEVGAAYYEAN